MRRSMKVQEEAMSMVLRRLDALEEVLDFEERISRLEEHDIVERLSKLEAVVGICEVQESQDKADDRATQSAANDNKDGACKKPEPAEVYDCAIASNVEQ